jgi:hypothetical protein
VRNAVVGWLASAVVLATRQLSDHPSGDPMRLTIRLLIFVGTPLLAIGVASLILLGAFTCSDSGCGSAAQQAAAVTERVTAVAPFTILSAVPVTVAWIVCLVQLVRTRHRAVAGALALALPLAAALSLSLYYTGTAGTWNPTHLAAFAAERSVGVLLLWPVATFVATFTVRRR